MSLNMRNETSYLQCGWAAILQLRAAHKKKGEKVLMLNIFDVKQLGFD